MNKIETVHNGYRIEVEPALEFGDERARLDVSITSERTGAHREFTIMVDCDGVVISSFATQLTITPHSYATIRIDAEDKK